MVTVLGMLCFTITYAFSILPIRHACLFGSHKLSNRPNLFMVLEGAALVKLNFESQSEVVRRINKNIICVVLIIRNDFKMVLTT